MYLPSIQGQVTVWRGVLDQEAAKADEVYQFGNLIGLSDYAADSYNTGPNMDVLTDFSKRTQLSKWHQLIGPNEIAALNMPETWTNAKSRVFLRDLWMGDAPASTALAVRGRLFSHGGLTYGEWLDIGKPETAEEAAELLNKRYAQTLYQGPCYALGSAPNFSANPIWAHPSRELYPSWISAPESLPFDQVTGGGSLNNPEGRALAGNDSIYKFIDKLRYHQYGSKVEIKGQRIISLELGLGDVRLPSLPKDKQIYVERLELKEA
jgi:hypothetical protein